MTSRILSSFFENMSHVSNSKRFLSRGMMITSPGKYRLRYWIITSLRIEIFSRASPEPSTTVERGSSVTVIGR